MTDAHAALDAWEANNDIHDPEASAAAGCDLADAIREILADPTETFNAFCRAQGIATYQEIQTGNDEEVKEWEAVLADRDAQLAKVRAYAEDRAFHAKGHLNTVNSGRIASDLLAILDTPASAYRVTPKEQA